VILREDLVGGRARVTTDEEYMRVVTGLNRDQVVEILRLVCCENLICKRKEFILDTFIYSEPV